MDMHGLDNKNLIREIARYTAGIGIISYALYGFFTKHMHVIAGRYDIIEFISGDTPKLKFFVVYYLIFGVVILILPLLFPRSK